LHKTKFLELLKDPIVTKLNDDSNELESLIKDYPYFQTGRILLAKEKYAHDALDVKKYIAEAAVHTTDRRLLKKYIEQEIQTINEEGNYIIEKETIKGLLEKQEDAPVAEASDTNALHTPDPESSDSESSINEYTDAAVEENLNLEKSEVASEEDQSEEDRLIKEKIAKYRSALSGSITDTPADPIIPAKEETFLPVAETSAEESSLKKEEGVIDLSTIPSQSTDQASVPTPNLMDSDQSTDSEEPTSRIDRLISEVQQDMEDLKASKLRFQAMVSKIDKEEKNEKNSNQAVQPKEKKINTAPKKKKANQKKVNKTTTKKVSPAIKKKSKKAAVNQTKEAQPKQQDQKIIIDEFIDSNPKIKPIKPTDVKKPTEDLSAKSTEFEPDSSSEYLASIYIEQNRINKAIAIYESLSLKFPEKKSYFAGLIKKLKTK
jgi:hypothetical protein